MAGKTYSEVMDMNAKSAQKKGPKVLDEIRHRRSANGGHVFTHSFANTGPGYHESETHTFGSDEGEKAVEHFKKYAGVTGSEDNDREEGESAEHRQRAGLDKSKLPKDSAAGAAY